VRIGIDLSADERRQPPARAAASAMRIAIATDGKTWERNLVHTGLGSCISLWVAGVPDGAAKEDVAIWLNGDELPAIFLSEPDPRGLRQINAMLPSGARPGEYSVAAGMGSAVSPPVPVKLV
jgi:hypothetical protein